MSVQDYFENREIDFHVAGEKNVTRGWVNIQCPFPGCSDPSWHLGVNLKSNIYNCYICGSKGHAIKLIKFIERCSLKSAEKIFKSFIDSDYENEEEIEIKYSDKCVLPLTENIFHSRHWKYLKKRNYNPDYIIEKYKLKSVFNIGEYKFRIIIPYFFKNKLVTFNTRDISNKSKFPYLFNPESNSIIPVKHTLYNIDSVKDKCFIVEGPFDVFRLGDGAVATSGKEFTKEQIIMLKEKGIKKAIVIYDADDFDEFGNSVGEKLANQLSGIIRKVELIQLEKGDPGELSPSDAKELRKLL